MSNFIPDATQAGYIRTRTRPQYAVIFDPCTPVFRAQIATTTTGPSFLQLEYEDVSLGAFGDIRVGMAVIISETADHTLPIRDYKDMRVADDATSTIIPIGEYDLELEAGWYITVLNTYKALQQPRQGALIDGRLPFEAQTATIKNLRSVYFVLSDDVGVFNLSPEIETVDGATVTSTLYDIPDAVYLTGTSADLEIEIEMPADSHTWGRLTYTLSTGVTRYMVFQLIVSPIVGSDLPTMGIRQPRITRNWKNHHATCTALKGVSINQVMNGTRCVIVVTAAFDGGAVPIDPVQFVGYLVKEGNQTNSASDKSASFEIASIWERAGQLPMHRIAIRDSATPDAWDEIDLPTPQRVINHILSRYSTVLTLCALNLDDVGDTWYAGEYNLSSDSIGDSVQGVVEEYNAVLTQKPSGELFLRRDLRFEGDDVRDDAPTVWTLTNRDISSYEYNEQHGEKVGRVIIGVRSFYTNRSPSVGGRAAAPSVILGTSPTTDTIPAQLMPADKTPLELFGDPLDQTSVGLVETRAAQLLAVANSPYDATASAWPGLFWLNPNNFEWIEANLAASLMTRGRSITGRHLLVGVELDIDASGTPITRLELTPETREGSGFVVGNLVPNVSALDWTVTPIQQPYAGNFGAPSSWNTTDFPPFTRDNMGNQGFPEPQDQAADEARQSAPAGTRSFAISFANASAVQAGFLSNLGDPYTITMQGSARIKTGYTVCTDLTASSGGWTATDAGGNPNPNFGFWDSGGLAPHNPTQVFFFTLTPLPGIVISSITFTFNEGSPAWRLGKQGGAAIDYSGPAVTTVTFDATTHPTFFPLSLATPVYITPSAFNLAVTTTFRVTQICIDAGAQIVPLYGDGAGYIWEKNDEGEEINVSFDGSRGLYIDGAPIASPPLYDPSHAYTVSWTGNGNNPAFVYEDDDHTDNEKLNLNLNISGTNAGT